MHLCCIDPERPCISAADDGHTIAEGIECAIEYLCKPDTKCTPKLTTCIGILTRCATPFWRCTWGTTVLRRAPARGAERLTLRSRERTVTAISTPLFVCLVQTFTA